MFNLGFPTASRVAQHDNPVDFHDIMILRWRLLGRLAGSKVSFEWIIGVGDTIPIGREKRVNVDRRQSQVACNTETAARSAGGSNPRHQANRVGTWNSSQDYLDLARGKFPTHFRLFLGGGRKNFELPTSSFLVPMIGSAAIVIAGMMSGRLFDSNRSGGVSRRVIDELPTTQNHKR